MKKMPFMLTVILVTGMSVYVGILQGRMCNRWGTPSNINLAADELQNTPERFGDWRMIASHPLDEGSRNMLKCAGYIVRTYENHRTGDAVDVTVILGPTGTISVHTPEVCLSSKNFPSTGPRQISSITSSTGNDDRFWYLEYKVDSPTGDRLRVYYGWSLGREWTAPTDARYAFVGTPYLCKIQVGGIVSSLAAESQMPCRDFLRDFLPVLNEHLPNLSEL